MSPTALPAAVVHALRDPLPEPKDFTPTRFQPQSDKAWFAGHILRFISADFPRHHFTKRFYAQLIHCFGQIAHYDSLGYWTEFFTSTSGKVEFLEGLVGWPCYGCPTVTWSDVERQVIRRLRETNLLAFYRQRLHAEQDDADRAELARLMAKYGQGDAAAEPGILRTVLVPVNRPALPRPSRHLDDIGQLALGLG